MWKFPLNSNGKSSENIQFQSNRERTRTVNNLKIQVQFGGENTKINGTIRIKGTTHVIECSGSASDRGTYAIVDGQEYWWCGSDQNFENPLIEREIERILIEVYKVAIRKRIDVESDWIAIVKAGIRVWQCCSASELTNI